VVVLLRFLPVKLGQAAEINEIGLVWPIEPITIHSSLQRIRPRIAADAGLFCQAAKPERRAAILILETHPMQNVL
jgi:hypothetical protein